MRRFFIIIAIVIVLLGIGVAVYFFYFNNQPGVTVAPPDATLPLSGQEVPVTAVEPALPAPPRATPGSARLVMISAGPVVPGEALVDSKATASSTAEVSVSYIERQSGNVYAYQARAGTRTRTSNKTVPGVQSAAWLPNGTTAFVRYLSGSDFSTINTYALPANGADGFFLAQNLSDISVSSTSVLTLASGVNGSIASLSRTDGTHSSTAFETPLSSLRVSFAGKNQYLAFTKPTATLGGSAFLVAGGRFSRVAGPLDGLSALASPSGKWILVSYFANGALQMELVNALTGELLPLPVATIAEKCVWTADDLIIYCGIPVDPPANASYPDDWYQGAVSFTDRIWRIQVAGRYAQLVLDFSKENNASLDAEALAVDPLNSVLVFVNKNDGSLWSYSL